MPARPRFPWKAVAAGGAALGGLGALALVARRSTGPTAKRVALIGDSYAVGLGPELEKLLPAIRGEAHKSTNTAQWAAHSAACVSCGDWLTTFKPNVVLVSLGVNDGSTPNQANYQTIVRSLHGIGARVIWIEPPADVKHVDAERRIIASLGVQTIPATKIPLAADGIHPSGTGYRTWAHDIAQAVARV